MRPTGPSPTTIIIAVVILCLAPFANKAFHIDDPLFLWTAEHIQTAPLDFYGFDVNWYGFEMRISDVQKNPPLVSYYIALIASIFGWSELALHLGLLVPAIAAALGTYHLAREFGSRPLLACLAAVLTPGFIVSSTNVMCDTTMLAFFVWSVWFWVRGLKERKRWFLVAACILIVLCTLTKYFGLALIPLLFAYALMRERGVGKWAGYFVIPVVLLAIYQWLTFKLYGRGLLMDAASYASGIQESKGVDLYSKLMIALSFTGGCLITGLFFAPMLWSRRQLIIGLLVLAGLAAPLLWLPQIGFFPLRDAGHWRWSTVLQTVVFVGGGFSLVALALADFWQRRDADSVLLFLWGVGTVAFACLVNWSVNGRSLLPLAPVTGILIMRRLEKASVSVPNLRIVIALAASALVSIWVAWADYSLANVGRKAAINLVALAEPGKKTWFQGHWGFQYYAQKYGLHPVDFRFPEIEPGEPIIAPAYNTNCRDIDGTVLARTVDFPVPGRVTSMSPISGAGFYSDLWGPLPFCIGSRVPERYFVFSVERQVEPLP